MTDWLQLVVAGAAGSVGTFGVQWLRSRAATAGAALNVGARLQEHWTKTTIDLVDALRDELHQAREKLADYLEIKEKLAHLEEALDHIHALLSAEGLVEIAAAQRRARAFLRRMRPDPAAKKGEVRQDAQLKVSKARIERDAEQGKID